MKATKKQMIDYIYNNFTKDGKKLNKKKLELCSIESLENVIKRNNCEEKLNAWINKPKKIKFLVDGKKDGQIYEYEYECTSEEELKEIFNSYNIEIVNFGKKSTHHRCGYCGEITKGKEKDLLCDDCRETFGHSLYSEL